MTISHLLEDFGESLRGAAISITDISLEEERLAAFETGYQAGWDDAVKSQKEDERRIAADLAQNLQDLTFTYEEAYAAVLNALHPLLEQMVATVLPPLSQDTLAPRLAEILQEKALDHGRQPIVIAAAPGDMTRMETLIETLPGLDIALAEDDTLAPGQIFLRFGETEEEINLDSVLRAIEHAVSGFFQENRKAIA
ncbi:flagellar biosynthesis/type III secretory pathway protein FliH [Roseovarius sp. MBR-154]|jgi:flagellar assembly protein FliH